MKRKQKSKPRKLSPVTKADVKLCCAPPYVDVRFKPKQQLDQLIQALVDLRDSRGKDLDHVHLQDTEVADRGLPTHTEIVFFRPRNKRDEIDEEPVKEWQESLKALTETEQ